jgi:hypothetical protein
MAVRLRGPSVYSYMFYVCVDMNGHLPYELPRLSSPSLLAAFSANRKKIGFETSSPPPFTEAGVLNILSLVALATLSRLRYS